MERQQQSTSTTTRRDHKMDVRGIRRKFDVHREDDEIIGPFSMQSATAADDAASMVNVDVVSEKIDVHVDDGVAIVRVRVRCERIVPIRGSTELYKKSAVIVTRLFEIDLLVTDERRRLYERVLERSAERRASSDQDGQLGTEDTFALYKALMSLADNDQTSSRERLHIERLLDEQQTRAATLVDADDFLGTSAARSVHRRPPQPPPRPSASLLRHTQNVHSASSKTVQQQRVGAKRSSDPVTSFMY